ncbi:MAG: hypothetical protein AB1371_00115 [Pseudomonadota bacterium]
MHAKTALASLLIVSAVQSHAQSLGAVQGAVIIGRPLDIVVQGQWEAGDGGAAVCVEADVRYGETRLAAGSVSVTVERGSAGASVLRVRARQPVNEPFVTIELRVGCPARFARAYTLLADIEPAQPAAPVAAPVTRAPVGVTPATLPPVGAASPAPAAHAAPAAVRTPLPETPIRSLATTPRPAGIRMATKVRPVPAVPATQREDSGAVRSAPPPPPERRGPRLELAPVDIPGTGAPGGAAPETAATAPAAPQTSAATEPASPAADGTPPAAVQQEIATLRAEQQRLLMAVESLNRELTQARESRADGLLVALSGLVVVLLGAVLWLWQRARKAVPAPSAWWTSTTAALGAADAPPAGPAAPAVREPAAAADHMAGLEVSEAGASVFQEVPIAALDVAALHALWEQVDFFESLGQAADAVAALRAFVQAHPRASEAPYLRWWALAQAHGLDTRLPQAMYEQHFQRLLAREPGTEGVEADRALVQALVAQWPTDAARRHIEAALASQPGDPATPLRVRTLTAFDDLLVLHGVLDLLLDVAPAPGVAGAAAAGTGGMGAQALGAAATTDVALPAPTESGALDFELPDISAWAAPAAEGSPGPAPAPQGDEAVAPPPPAAAADDGLDFDLGDWQLPADTPPQPPRG